MDWLFKKKSGNGTWAPQYIYILYNRPYWFVTKIGITGYPQRRLHGIRTDPDAIGTDFYLLKIKMFGAYYVEQFLHRLFFVFKVPWKGSGRTERFLVIVVIPAVVLLIGFKIIDIIKIPILLTFAMYTLYALS